MAASNGSDEGVSRRTSFTRDSSKPSWLFGSIWGNKRLWREHSSEDRHSAKKVSREKDLSRLIYARSYQGKRYPRNHHHRSHHHAYVYRGEEKQVGKEREDGTGRRIVLAAVFIAFIFGSILAIGLGVHFGLKKGKSIFIFRF